jgi:outer membrane protein OmpA-like peptidoglycan-associated protein
MITFRPARLAALLAIAIAPPALAADSGGDAFRILGAPNYLPSAGEVEGSFTYTYQAEPYDLRTNLPNSFPSSYDRSETILLPSLTYGVTDDISVFASFDWGDYRNDEIYTYRRVILGMPIRRVPTQAHTSFRGLGAGDPSFGATWRAVDQIYAPVNVDLTGYYTPDIFSGRGSGLRETGTFAAGGQSGTVEAAISRDLHLITLRAYGSLTYDGRRNETIDDGTEDLRSGAHAEYGAGFQGEVRLLPYLAVNAGVQADQAMKYDRPILSASGTTPVTFKPNGSLSPYGGVVLPIVPNHLVAELLYQHDFINDQSEVYASGEVQRNYKQGGNEYIARILFRFGGPSPSAPPPPAALPPPQLPGPPIDRTYLVFFDWDRADLSNRARQIIAEAARETTRAQATRIEVNGYTDLSGTAAYNQRLSVRRAHAVETELVRDGVSQSEITIHGYGEQHPLVPTAPGVREPQNRRVEIYWR